MEKSEGHRGRNIIITLLIIGAVVGLGIYFSMRPAQKTNAAWEPRTITPENLPENLQRFTLVHDLPEDGIIEFSVGENSYTIRKGEVSAGAPANPDISIYLPDSYLSVMGQYGWCAALQSAKAKGELRVQAHGSETSLAWKYRSLLSYQSCLG